MVVHFHLEGWRGRGTSLPRGSQERKEEVKAARTEDSLGAEKGSWKRGCPRRETQQHTKAIP